MAPPTLLHDERGINDWDLDDYCFHIYSLEDTALLKNLETHFPEIHDEVIQEYNGFRAHLLGKHVYLDIPFLVRQRKDHLTLGQKKHEFYIYSFRSREEYNQLKKGLELRETEKQTELDQDFALYRFSRTYERKGTFHPLDIDTLIGCDAIYQDILNQIDAHTTQSQFLKSVGEDGRSLNILFCGPPGTGKTTMVTVLATKLRFPIYIVDPAAMMQSHLIKAALTPKNEHSNNSQKLLLFDDIDRYMQTDGTGMMSQILNSLDGLDDDSNVIRFFSANDERILQRIPALMSRFTATYKFKVPTEKHMMKKVDKLMQFYGKDWKTKFNTEGEAETLCQKAIEHGLSFRVFTNYMIRFLFPPPPAATAATATTTTTYNPLHVCLDPTNFSTMLKFQAAQNLDDNIRWVLPEKRGEGMDQDDEEEEEENDDDYMEDD